MNVKATNKVETNRYELELEVSAFESYFRSRTQERREEYVLACVRTKRCLLSLPFSYSQIGQDYRDMSEAFDPAFSAAKSSSVPNPSMKM